MPAWTRGRLGLMVLFSVLIALAVVAASYVYFRAGPQAPEGADVVREGRNALPEAAYAAASPTFFTILSPCGDLKTP